MKMRFRMVATLALAVSLAVVPLSACSSQSESDTAFDTSSISTLADALTVGVNTCTGWDENYFVCVTEVNGTPVRLVAAFDKDLNKKLSQADLVGDEDNENLIEVVGDLVPLSVEDLSLNIPSEEELNALVGKTGQDLIDEGYTFVYYNMYDADTTMATYAKGYANFDFEFDATVSGDDTEDEGKSLLDKTITSATYSGPSDYATDPTQVEPPSE